MKNSNAYDNEQAMKYFEEWQKGEKIGEGRNEQEGCFHHNTLSYAFQHTPIIIPQFVTAKFLKDEDSL